MVPDDFFASSTITRAASEDAVGAPVEDVHERQGQWIPSCADDPKLPSMLVCSCGRVGTFDHGPGASTCRASGAIADHQKV